MAYSIDRFIHSLVDDKDATMTGRSGKQKAKDFAEVTTSIDLIDKQLALLPKEMFLDLTKTVLDPCTGDGRYLMRYLYHRLPAIKTADDLIQAIRTLYGIELQAVNVTRARNNLYLLTAKIAEYLCVGMDYDQVHKILGGNIRQGDALKIMEGMSDSPQKKNFSCQSKNRRRTLAGNNRQGLLRAGKIA